MRARVKTFHVLLLALFVHSGLANAGETESLPDVHRPSLQVILQPVQTEMRGPQPLSRFGSSILGDIGYFFGELTALAGHSAVSAVTYMGSDEKKESQESARSLTEAFVFNDAIVNGLSGIDNGAFWRLSEIYPYNFEGRPRGTAKRIFGTNDIEYILFLKSTYFISPELNQIRLLMETSMYRRRANIDLIKPLYARNYEYLSQSRGDLFRSFRDGEKEALIESIESNYDEQVGRYPHNLKAYKKDRKRALATLRNRDVILPAMAIREGWSDESFVVGLQRATDHVMEMMREDLRDIGPRSGTDNTYVSFNGLKLSGKPKEFKGYALREQGLNRVYRDEDGNLYSVPQ